MKSPGRRIRVSAAIVLWLAVLSAVALSPRLARADEYVIFTWGGRLRVLSHSLDLENMRMKLVVGEDSTVSVPLSSVARIVDADDTVVLEIASEERVLDPEGLTDGSSLVDVPGAVDASSSTDGTTWNPIEGWAEEEIWDSWAGAPKWTYRWTDVNIAWAFVAAPSGRFDGIELRVLPMSYALRVLGEVPVPEIQFLRVSLEGELLGDLMLSDQGWTTYRLALPSACEECRGLLRLEASYLARPADFSRGLNSDTRELGIAVDYIHFVSLGADEAGR